MRRTIWIVLALVTAGAIIFALVYWNVPPTVRAPETASTTQALESLIVTAEPVMRSFARRVPWSGTVQSTSTVQLTALEAGRVEAIPAADQAPVKAGTPVIVLGGLQLSAQRARLQANVESLQEQLSLATQTVQTLQENVAGQLVTKSELAAAQADQAKLLAQLRDAQLALESSRAQANITAPVAGVFTDRRVSVGQPVRADEVLGEIIDPNHLRIVASLFPPAAAPLQGKEATVRLPGGEPLTGTVGQVLPQASNTGATIVWIEGLQIDKRLRPGQTVTGEITVEVGTFPAVPGSAVVYGPQEQPYVFVRQDGKYERRDVRVGQIQNGWIEILSGIEPGQMVVTQGAYELLNREFSSQYRVED
jgi:RND family efflux transporter MFP subunit